MDREPPRPSVDEPGEAALRIARALSQTGSDPSDALAALIGPQACGVDAAAVAHRLVVAAPREPGSWVLMGSVAAAQRHPQAARLCWQRALACDPSHVEARVLLGSALQASGELDAAQAHLDVALSIEPRNPGAIASAAQLLLLQGARAEAWALLQGVDLSSDPRLALAAALTAGPQQAEVALWAVDAALAAVPAPSPRSIVSLLAARGELCDLLGRPTEAFAAWAESNRRARRSPGGGLDELEQIIAGTAGWDWGTLPTHTPQRPIVLVGLPCSGVSLLEQLLSRMPQIHTAPVLGSLGLLAEALLRPGDPCWTAALPRLQGPILDPLRTSYLDALGPAQHGRVLDGWRGNLCYLGLLARILPGARVIVCTRGPMDAGLSCFRRGGGSGQDWSMSLEGIGDRIVQSQRLLAHWRRHLPLRFHTVAYESLVASPEEVLQGVVAFLELPWDPDALRPTGRASSALLPLHTRSVGRARTYEAFLRPLATRLSRR